MKNKEPLERWHGAHHYSDRTHLFLLIFLLFTFGTLLWSYYGMTNARLLESINKIPQATITYFPKQTPTITPTPTPTCIPRPACLDATPRCLMPETSDMCPKTTPTKTPKKDKVFCTQDAKKCPNGSYVGRIGPYCDFEKCSSVN